MYSNKLSQKYLDISLRSECKIIANAIKKDSSLYEYIQNKSFQKKKLAR